MELTSEGTATPMNRPKKQRPGYVTVTFTMTDKQHERLMKICNALSRKSSKICNRSMALRWIIETYKLSKGRPIKPSV